MPATEQQQSEWKGLEAIGSDGEEVGEVVGFYTDSSGNTDWLTIKSGLFGRKLNFVPADGAEQDGSTLKLLFTKDAVHSAPKIDDDGELSEEEERELFAHYDQAWGDSHPQAEAGDDGAAAAASDDTAERPKSGTDDAPVTHDEDDDIRDPDKGTRLDALEMKRPEHEAGIRPMPGEESDFDPSKEGVAGDEADKAEKAGG